MTAVSKTDSSLTTKCLDFCQALAGQGKCFKFSITIGSTFTFSLDTRGGKETLPTRNKKSPSTLRRNAKRRKEFLSKKSTSESASAADLESNQQPTKQSKGFQCNQCELDFKTENGLKIHKGRSHKEVYSPEKLRKSSTQPPLPGPPSGTRPGWNPATTVVWTCPPPTFAKMIKIWNQMKCLKSQLFVDVAVGLLNVALATMS